jgi:hypothetical protein
MAHRVDADATGCGTQRLSFQRLLRRLEYLENCRRDPVGRVLTAIAVWRYKRRSILLGFTIPRNAFGPGLSIAHYAVEVLRVVAAEGGDDVSGYLVVAAVSKM